MGWLDSLFGNAQSEPQSHDGGAGAGSGWLGPIASDGTGRAADKDNPLASLFGGTGNAINGGIAGLFGQAGPSAFPRQPSLLDRISAGATNLTTGGNPLAGIVNAANGLATGQRTDGTGLELAKQRATMQALLNAGLDANTARAAAMNPEFLKALVVARYGVRPTRHAAVSSTRAGIEEPSPKQSTPIGDVGANAGPEREADVTRQRP
jgi:hypothetical protein